MSGKIVWLASYFKSGNTWVRALLTNYLRDCTEPAHINELEGGLVACSRPLFDECVGIEATRLPPQLVDRLRPRVFDQMAREADGTLFVKVHDAWRVLDTGEPMFPSDATYGVLYIVRNPLDVAPSFAHHAGISVDSAIGRMCDPSYRTDGRNSEQLPQTFGSWSDHVRSWLDQSVVPVHVVRYEELHSSPVATLAAILRFLGSEVEGGRLERAIGLSSFEMLRSQEARDGFNERAPAASVFFRRGEVGNAADELDERQAARLVAAHGPTMRRLGYATGLAGGRRWSRPATSVDGEPDHQTAAQDRGCNRA